MTRSIDFWRVFFDGITFRILVKTPAFDVSIVSSPKAELRTTTFCFLNFLHDFSKIFDLLFFQSLIVNEINGSILDFVIFYDKYSKVSDLDVKLNDIIKN